MPTTTEAKGFMMKTLTNNPPPHPNPPLFSNPPPSFPQPPVRPFPITCPSCSASRSWMLLNEAEKHTIKKKEQLENATQ